MSASRLSGRLERIRAASAAATKAARDTSSDLSVSADVTAAGESDLLPTWRPVSRYLFERETTVPFPEYRNAFSRHFPLLFPRERETLAAFGDFSEMLRSLVFFDLETTGLSHGAGTVAFMAGVARFQADASGTGMQLSITQILLADYPGEPDFLARFDQLLGPKPILGSFNGKCFDSQILATRFLMNGMRPAYLREPVLHLDLLFPARRVWKKQLGSCRLGVLETEVLGHGREDDLPGSEAPEAWFDFVRLGKTDRLLKIGDHNRDDCISLPRLLFALDEAIEEGHARAGLIRALDLRSRREYAEASAFLDPLAAVGDPIALRLLAIDSEHRIGDLDRALECAMLLGDEARVNRITEKRQRNNIVL
jgi:uncharacterized protein YprB with RNaseH-like and TPR domain